MKINHLSVSRSGVWQTCPQQYKYKYHLEMQSLEEPGEWFDYGKLVHKIIEVYTKNKGERSIGDITKDVFSGKIPCDTDKNPNLLSDDYKRKLPDHLRSFMKLTNQIGTDGEIEWEFMFDLEPPNNKMLKGVIDRLIHKNGEIYILDYKTTKQGRFRKSRHTITDDLQLQCYCKVVSDYFKVSAENIRAALYYLDGGDLIPVKFSNKTLDNVCEKMREIYDDISKSNPDTVRGNVGSHCKFCGYRKICPFYSLT